jgi:hypothetical protein
MAHRRKFTVTHVYTHRGERLQHGCRLGGRAGRATIYAASGELQAKRLRQPKSNRGWSRPCSARSARHHQQTRRTTNQPSSPQMEHPMNKSRVAASERSRERITGADLLRLGDLAGGPAGPLSPPAQSQARLRPLEVFASSGRSAPLPRPARRSGRTLTAGRTRGGSGRGRPLVPGGRTHGDRAQAVGETHRPALARRPPRPCDLAGRSLSVSRSCQ